MTDGREEPSASYKLGNGWVILHWCANLTIILVYAVSRSSLLQSIKTHNQMGQASVVWRDRPSCGARRSGHSPADNGYAPAFHGVTGLHHCATCALFLTGVAWYFAAHAIVPALGGILAR